VQLSQTTNSFPVHSNATQVDPPLPLSSIAVHGQYGRDSMNKFVGAFLAAGLIVTLPANAQAQSEDAAKLAEAHAIIAVMFPPAQRAQMIEKIMRAFEAQIRPAVLHDAMGDPGLKAIVDEYSERALKLERPVVQEHIPAMMEASAVAYTHEFSLAELKDIHAFALTPSGSHYLSRSSAILNDPEVAKVNTEMALESQATAKTLMPEFKDKLVAYLKAHPDVAAKIKSQ